MSEILTGVGTVFSQAINWVGTVGTTITGNPLLMLFCTIPLVGLGVGMFKRLLHM